ncbi:MAG: GNAT family N-acetyltransferase [Candidatus Woesearchaeota archaeon]
MKIRKYKSSDRKQVEHINFETAFLGKSMSKFLSNNKIYKNNIKYYVEKEPESIFVLEDKNKVVGYLLGCLDDKNNSEIFEAISTNMKNFFKSFFLPKKDRIYWRGQFFQLLNILLTFSPEMRFKTPKNAGHIHINLLPEARGKNYGTKLLNEYAKYAKTKGAKIIHAGSFKTNLNPNTNFWLKNKFKVYSEIKTSIWKKQLPKENIKLVCYVREL